MSYPCPSVGSRLVGRALLVSVLVVCRVCPWWWCGHRVSLLVSLVMPCLWCVLRLAHALMVSYPITMDMTHASPHQFVKLSIPFTFIGSFDTLGMSTI